MDGLGPCFLQEKRKVGKERASQGFHAGSLGRLCGFGLGLEAVVGGGKAVRAGLARQLGISNVLSLEQLRKRALSFIPASC